MQLITKTVTKPFDNKYRYKIELFYQVPQVMRYMPDCIPTKNVMKKFSNISKEICEELLKYTDEDYSAKHSSYYSIITTNNETLIDALKQVNVRKTLYIFPSSRLPKEGVHVLKRKVPYKYRAILKFPGYQKRAYVDFVNWVRSTKSVKISNYSLGVLAKERYYHSQKVVYIKNDSALSMMKLLLTDVKISDLCEVSYLGDLLQTEAVLQSLPEESLNDNNV